MISTTEHSKKFIEVNGKRMAYVEMGEGDPILFQHGLAHVRLDPARSHAVGQDAVGRQLCGKRFGQADHRALGRGVMGDADIGDDQRVRAGEDGSGFHAPIIRRPR